MKDRILNNWTFTRLLYLIIGLTVVIDSLISAEWLALIMGGYIASMGLFSFGCAANGCFTSNNNTKQQPLDKVTFEELKNK